MPADYKKLYAYLMGQVDEALDIMGQLDMIPTAQLRKKLESALLTAEEMYLDQSERE